MKKSIFISKHAILCIGIRISAVQSKRWMYTLVGYKIMYQHVIKWLTQHAKAKKKFNKNHAYYIHQISMLYTINYYAVPTSHCINQNVMSTSHIVGRNVFKPTTIKWIFIHLLYLKTCRCYIHSQQQWNEIPVQYINFIYTHTTIWIDVEFPVSSKLFIIASEYW